MDVTLGNVASTNLLTFAGPTQARTITFPDAAMTVARTDAANTFTGAQTFSSAVVLSAGAKQPSTAKLTDGAIAVFSGTMAITKGSALGSSTLATPTATTHDGYRARFISTTAFAHVISVASGKVNGGANTTITFGGAIGDAIELEAYQGVWYTAGAPRNVTIS